MPLRTWNGSSFKTAKSASVWNGSSWVNAKSARVWNGSSWVNFLSSVNITDQNIGATGGGYDQASATAAYTLLSNGTATTLQIGDSGYIETTLSGEWLTGGAVSDFSVRATATTYYINNYDQFFSGPLDTWVSLSTTREWAAWVDTRASSSTAYVQLLIEIAYTADTSTVIDSATVTLEATGITAL